MNIRYGKTLKGALTILLLAVAAFSAVSCQQFFTTSTMGWIDADPASMPTEQKKSYAQSALKSGKAAKMQEALDALVSAQSSTTAEQDPELYLLTVDLAVGASGTMDAVFDTLEAYSTDPSSIDIATIVDGIDAADLASAVSSMEAVAASIHSGTIKESQYANAALAQTMVVVDQLLTADPATDFSTLSSADLSAEQEASLNQAITWGQAAGVDQTLEDFGFDLSSWTS